jgi:outer membrane lipoprotein SlyB
MNTFWQTLISTRKPLVASIAPVLLACGCSSMNHTETGAVAGGAVGAGVGALAGAACHNPGVGAAIGAGAGALTGALVGHSMDKSEQQAKDQAVAAVQAQQQQQQLGISDVARMAQQHISDAVIIEQIRTGGVVYHLTAADIEYLKGNGVSDPVILEMQATANRPGYVVAPGDPVYVVRPAPVVGVRFGGYWR